MINPSGKLQPRRPNWCLTVDEKTGYKHSSFHETKDGMVEPMCVWFKKWESEKKAVKIIRMDNAGENKKLVKRLNSNHWQLYLTIEYTARDTPQHNHLVEVGFATLHGHGRSMMIEANVPANKKHIVGQKAFQTATNLDNLTPIDVDGVVKTRAEHWKEKLPAHANHFRKWGEAGVVKVKTLTTPKMEERGITCMFVGYAQQHAGDCHEMLNLKTNRILVTRDVQWLNRMHFKNNGKPFDNNSDDDDEETEDDPNHRTDANGTNNVNTGNQGNVAQAPTQTTTHTAQQPAVHQAEQASTTRSGRTVKPPSRLVEEIGNAAMDEVSEIMAVGAGIGGGFTHTSELKPMKCEEAMKRTPLDGAKQSTKNTKE